MLRGCFFLRAVAAYGQQQINLTAAPATVTLPDGSQVPMWATVAARSSRDRRRLAPS